MSCERVVHANASSATAAHKTHWELVVPSLGTEGHFLRGALVPKEILCVGPSLSRRAIDVVADSVVRWQSHPSSGSADDLLLIIRPDLLLTL